MNDRNRTALVGIALALGFVAPFVIGFIAERQTHGIQWTDDRSPGPVSVDERRHLTEMDAFRSRFDAVEVGMADGEVTALLGQPSDDSWIEPTHAETWFTEADGISHKTWGPPWKVYWLLTSVNDRSRWWPRGDCQAFVRFNGNGIVEGKMWLEERREK